MIDREISLKILELSNQYPSILLTGPRQSGKTTLAKALFPNKKYYSFENPLISEMFNEDPLYFLKKIEAGAVLDEIQQEPKMLSFLQEEIDNNREPGRFVLTGSNNLKLMNRVSQSLAGRVAIFTLLPFSTSEIAKDLENKNMNDMIFLGNYPDVIYRKQDANIYYRNYIQTYIQRDIRLIKNIKNFSQFTKFLSLCAGRIGNIFDPQGISNDCGISIKTVEEWLTLLEVSYICFRLYPWYNNRTKRLVKKPKLYFYDTGLACAILGINNPQSLENDRIKGALFENYVIVDKMKKSFNTLSADNYYYYRTSKGVEVDLIRENGKFLTATEIKSSFTFTPEFSKNLLSFRNDYPEYNCNSEIIYAGSEVFDYKGINVHPLI